MRVPRQRRAGNGRLAQLDGELLVNGRDVSLLDHQVDWTGLGSGKADGRVVGVIRTADDAAIHIKQRVAGVILVRRRVSQAEVVQHARAGIETVHEQVLAGRQAAGEGVGRAMVNGLSLQRQQAEAEIRH
ncbi:hypothetical protein GCM10027277_07860 [Pseudoduganella ginsengisoli]